MAAEAEVERRESGKEMIATNAIAQARFMGRIVAMGQKSLFGPINYSNGVSALPAISECLEVGT